MACFIQDPEYGLISLGAQSAITRPENVVDWRRGMGFLEKREWVWTTLVWTLHTSHFSARLAAVATSCICRLAARSRHHLRGSLASLPPLFPRPPPPRPLHGLFLALAFLVLSFCSSLPKKRSGIPNLVKFLQLAAHRVLAARSTTRSRSTPLSALSSPTYFSLSLLPDHRPPANLLVCTIVQLYLGHSFIPTAKLSRAATLYLIQP